MPTVLQENMCTTWTNQTISLDQLLPFSLEQRNLWRPHIQLGITNQRSKRAPLVRKLFSSDFLALKTFWKINNVVILNIFEKKRNSRILNFCIFALCYIAYVQTNSTDCCHVSSSYKAISLLTLQLQGHIFCNMAL